MKMKYEELLEYMDPPEIDVPPLSEEELARIRRRVFEKLPQSQTKVKKRRRIRPLLIGLAAALALSITAGAVYEWLHTKEAALLAADPIDGGLAPVLLDDQAQAVIDQAATDYAMSAESEETTVTLDSAMGFHSEDYSLAYVTVTINAPAEDRDKLDPETLSFGRFALQPTDSEAFLAGDGSYSAVRNDDGSVSVMFCFLFRYQDVTDIPVTLTLRNIMSQGVRLSGEWTFPIDKLALSELTTVSFDSSLFQESLVKPYDIQISNFGGKITMRGYQAMLDAKFRSAVQEKYGDLDLDWDKIERFDPQFQALYGEGVLSEEEYCDIILIAERYPDGQSSSLRIGLEYEDGTVYSEIREFGVYPVKLLMAQRGQLTEEEIAAYAGDAGLDAMYAEDDEMFPFAFQAPQDISKASYLIIEDIKIPLS